MTPLMVEMEIENQMVDMEVDTGATVSIMAEETFKDLFPTKTICQSQLALKTYTGEALQIAGEATVKVSYQRKSPTQLKLILIKGAGPTLLGRSIFDSIGVA